MSSRSTTTRARSGYFHNPIPITTVVSTTTPLAHELKGIFAIG